VAEFLRGQLILAPLTKGGNLPFRRLCVELGCRVTMGEMALAHKLIRGGRSETALLRRHPTEPVFGAQIAGRNPEQLAKAARLAQERGASFVDLNLGCPIDLFCRQGIGAALMQKPGRVGRLVAAMVGAVTIPVTVKFRLGYDDDKPRFLEVGKAAEEAGATAVTLHGRSRRQRYRRAADWEAVGALVEALSIPVIGNGDLLTWRDVDARRRQSGCASVMIGRGALIKPWIFKEIERGEDLLLDAATRIKLLRRYLALALEHFGDDERGRARVADFLSFHVDFQRRYRPTPSERFGPEDHPLIQTREETPAPPAEGPAALLYAQDEESRAHLVRHLMEEEGPLADPADEILGAGAAR
jgi:tRNA-dihydrouridine synthase 3